MKSAKRKPGRPLVGREKRQRYQIRLEPSTAARIRKLGSDSLTRGIERLLQAREIREERGVE